MLVNDVQTRMNDPSSGPGMQDPSLQHRFNTHFVTPQLSQDSYIHQNSHTVPSDEFESDFDDGPKTKNGRNEAQNLQSYLENNTVDSIPPGGKAKKKSGNIFKFKSKKDASRAPTEAANFPPAGRVMQQHQPAVSASQSPSLNINHQLNMRQQQFSTDKQRQPPVDYTSSYRQHQSPSHDISSPNSARQMQQGQRPPNSITYSGAPAGMLEQQKQQQHQQKQQQKLQQQQHQHQQQLNQQKQQQQQQYQQKQAQFNSGGPSKNQKGRFEVMRYEDPAVLPMNAPPLQLSRKPQDNANANFSNRSSPGGLKSSPGKTPTIQTSIEYVPPAIDQQTPIQYQDPPAMQRLARTPQNGVGGGNNNTIASPQHQRHAPVEYSQDPDEMVEDVLSDEDDDAISVDFIEDQGMDEAIERNTEFNAIIENFHIAEPHTSNRNPYEAKKNVVFDLPDEGQPGDGRAPVKSRQSSLGMQPAHQLQKQQQPSSKQQAQQKLLQQHQQSVQRQQQMQQKQRSTATNAAVGPGGPQQKNPSQRKKKIRHVQIQTRTASKKEISVQTEVLTNEKPLPDTRDAQIADISDHNTMLESKVRELTLELKQSSERFEDIEMENTQIREEIEDNRVKFDKLSAQAYKKIKDLLMERKMLDVEVSTLRDQLAALQDAQAKKFLE